MCFPFTMLTNLISLGWEGPGSTSQVCELAAGPALLGVAGNSLQYIPISFGVELVYQFWVGGLCDRFDDLVTSFFNRLTLCTTKPPVAHNGKRIFVGFGAPHLSSTPSVQSVSSY